MEHTKGYDFGRTPGSWHEGRSQTITFVVTDDCNLRCRYCYITHKSSNNVMSLDVAKRFIDYMLTSDEVSHQDSVILEFIGGEPLIEVTLIDKIVDYYKIRSFELDHDWYWNYRISICTNGVNYSDAEVQRFIQKNFNKISLSISVDGVKEKHDMHRIFPDGTGSYDVINQSIPLWLSQFRPSTKMTFSSSDLPMLFDSVVGLWEKGIREVHANVVFEDVWKEGDDVVLEQQLMKLADYVLDYHLFDKNLFCSFFAEGLGFPYDASELDQTFCGAGKMLAVSPKGEFYPCIRYYGYSLNHHPEWSVGNLDTGIDSERVLPFKHYSNRFQSDEECLSCDVASGCGFCQGFNYDESAEGTNFYRAKYICNMHKARVRANDYYFARLKNEYQVERFVWNRPQRKRLFILLSENFVTYCMERNYEESDRRMGEEELRLSVEYARRNFHTPVFVHSRSELRQIPREITNTVVAQHIVPARMYDQAILCGYTDVIPVFEIEDITFCKNLSVKNCILNIDSVHLEQVAETVAELLTRCDRVNVNITELDRDFDGESYRVQLERLSDTVADLWKNYGRQVEVNVLTDEIFLDQHGNCGAGDRSFVVRSDGTLHTCCAEKTSIGDVLNGLNETYSNRLYAKRNHVLCVSCDAYQCVDCIHLNRRTTNEYAISPSFQCRKSRIEKECSENLAIELGSLIIIPEPVRPSNFNFCV